MKRPLPNSTLLRTLLRMRRRCLIYGGAKMPYSTIHSHASRLGLHNKRHVYNSQPPRLQNRRHVYNSGFSQWRHIYHFRRRFPAKIYTHIKHGHIFTPKSTFSAKNLPPKLPISHISRYNHFQPKTSPAKTPRVAICCWSVQFPPKYS